MSLREIPGVQEPTVKHAKRLGWLAWKMKIEGRRGCPDFWFFRNGKVVIVEFKKVDGEREAQQVLRARDLKAAGHTVHLIDSAEAGRALFDSME